MSDADLDEEYYGAASSRVNKPSLESFKAKKGKVEFADEDDAEDNGEDNEGDASDDSSDENSYGDDADEEE